MKKLKNIFFNLLHIICFVFVFYSSHVILTMFITFERAISASCFFDDSIIETREILALILSFLIACVINFKLIKKIIVYLKLEKYESIILKSLFVVTIVLSVSLFIFCRAFPL